MEGFYYELKHVCKQSGARYGILHFEPTKPPKTDKKTEKLYRKSLKLSVSRIEHPTKLDKTLQEPTMKTDNVNTFSDKGSEGSTPVNKRSERSMHGFRRQ